MTTLNSFKPLQKKKFINIKLFLVYRTRFTLKILTLFISDPEFVMKADIVRIILMSYLLCLIKIFIKIFCSAYKYLIQIQKFLSLKYNDNEKFL